MTPKVEPPKDDWEKEFDDKMGNYTDGLPEMYVKGVKPSTKGFWLRSGMDGEIDERLLKDFIRQVIKLQQEALLSKVEAELPVKYNNWSDVPDSVVGGLPSYSKKLTYRKAHNQSINQVKTAVNKLRLEL